MAPCSYSPGWALLVFPALLWAGWPRHPSFVAEPLTQPRRHWDLRGSAAGMHSPRAALAGHFLALQAPARIQCAVKYRTLIVLLKRLQGIISNPSTETKCGPATAGQAQRAFTGNTEAAGCVNLGWKTRPRLLPEKSASCNLFFRVTRCVIL